jgi:hypothetical protein
MDTPTRLKRFGDWAHVAACVKSGNVSGHVPFYGGSNIDRRMRLVRQAIEYIRANWGDHSEFMSDLREFMGRPGMEIRAPHPEAHKVAKLFSGTKSWSKDGDLVNDDYSAIRLYTSEFGYRRIFKVLNEAFRREDLTGNSRALRSAVFLVELLTIDLFNFRHAYPHVDNFKGVVYRGMCLSTADLRRFAQMARGRIDQRYLSIPLAMASASVNREKSLAFAMAQAAPSCDRHALLWRIHVASLDAEPMRLYQSEHPTSVVTSLCAVPIDDLSDYPDEKEVLLRGPFFQILSLQREDVGSDAQSLYVLDAVMINSNRDHPSSLFESGAEAQRARNLFRILVATNRTRLCVERADQLGLSTEASAFRSILEECRRNLDVLLR